MLFEIKHKLTGSVLFKLETTSIKLCLDAAISSGADLHGADLGGADLGGADLRGAYLRGADLHGADLHGAKIKGNITIKSVPISINTGIYDILIFDAHMQIGCEFHSFDEWFVFNDKEIALMEDKVALRFWRKWRGLLKPICDSRNEREA